MPFNHNNCNNTFTSKPEKSQFSIQIEAYLNNIISENTKTSINSIENEHKSFRNQTDNNLTPLSFISDGLTPLLPLNDSDPYKHNTSNIKNIYSLDNFISSNMSLNHTAPTNNVYRDTNNLSIDKFMLNPNNIHMCSSNTLNTVLNGNTPALSETDFCYSTTISPEFVYPQTSLLSQKNDILTPALFSSDATPNILSNGFYDPSQIFTTPFMSSNTENCSPSENFDPNNSLIPSELLNNDIFSLLNTPSVQHNADSSQFNLSNQIDQNTLFAAGNPSHSDQAFNSISGIDDLIRSLPRPINKKLDSFKSTAFPESNPANLSRHSSFAPLEELFESFVHDPSQSSSGLFSTSKACSLQLLGKLASQTDSDATISLFNSPELRLFESVAGYGANSFAKNLFDALNNTSIPSLQDTHSNTTDSIHATSGPNLKRAFDISDDAVSSPSSKKSKSSDNSEVTRPFTCSICSRQFARKYNLKTHLTTHPQFKDVSKKFPCTVCNKQFTRKHDLKRHLSTIH
ncbi:Transcriptional regulator CRZ1 [Smittium culicis]|uniref:Transcriptional regulator CRZ1 n=1 Tax=Smittium culicis TaxID=133412 RepID=A0A1R1Y1W7_9FUNG|nr:Transcriptional regulator CRZ1 [Smittium culicis]